MSYPYRLVLCLDVNAGSLEEAYRKAYETMNDVCAKSDNTLEWESTDEAFDAEGEPVSPETMQDARMTVFANLRQEGKLPE